MPRFTFLLAALLLAPAAFAQPDLAGDWEGTIDVGGTQLTLLFHLTTPADSGAYAVTMDVPEQSAYGFPAENAVQEGDSLYIAVTGISAAFAGLASPEADSIDGAWMQGGRDFPLTLTRSAMTDTEDEAPKDGPKYTPGDLSGEWAGAIALPVGGEVRLGLVLTQTEGGYDAAITGPSGEPVALDTFRVDGSDIMFASEEAGMEVVGTVAEDEMTISGEWRQAGEKMLVTFSRR